MTIQEYKNQKLKCLETNYRLALTMLAELEALPAEDRDEDWQKYHTMEMRDKNRLEPDLPLFVIVDGEKQS